MADKIDKQLDKAIDDVLKDYENSITEAVKYASDRAVSDIYNRALGCLKEYYYAYTPETHEPNSYHRTDSLRQSFLPYKKIVHKKDSIVSEVGVKYDSSVLTMYTGSKKYPITDGSWVLDNYLRGIHPGTDGSREPYNYGEEEWLNTVKQYGQIDPVSPTEKMNNYIEKYRKTFDSNVLLGLVAQVAKKM